jgi:hypothetical protein
MSMNLVGLFTGVSRVLLYVLVSLSGLMGCCPRAGDSTYCGATLIALAGKNDRRSDEERLRLNSADAPPSESRVGLRRGCG